jgi:hypothetical protein
LREQIIYNNIYLKEWSLIKQEFDIQNSLPFVRYYNSHPVFINSKIWLWWNHNYDTYFDYNEDNGNISVIIPNGSFARFTLDKDFHYITEDRSWLTAKDDGNFFIITDVVSNEYIFSKNKQRLETIQYKDVPLLTIQYDKSDKIIQVSSTWSCGKNLYFTYDHNDFLSSIKDNNGVEIYYRYDLLPVWKEKYFFLKEVSYTKDKNISYSYNTEWLLIDDSENRYRFDNNTVTDLQNRQNNLYYQIVYSGSEVVILQKDEAYKDSVWKQTIHLDMLWNIQDIVTQSGTIQYNYTSSWILESIQDEKWNIQKISPSFGKYTCSEDENNWLNDTINKKLDIFIFKLENYINKKTWGNPPQEIIDVKWKIIDSLSVYLKLTDHESKKHYKKEILSFAQDLVWKLKKLKTQK